VPDPASLLTPAHALFFLQPKNFPGRTCFRFRRRFPAHAETARGHGCEPHRSKLEAGSTGQSTPDFGRRRVAQLIRVLYSATASGAQAPADRAEAVASD